MSGVAVDLGQLIELVASHPHLYDMKNKQYKENDTKENTWNEISIVLETPVEDCKRLWKNLRDRFSKEKRILKSGDPQRESEWVYFKKMAFYERYCTPRKTVTATRPLRQIMEADSEASVGSPLFSEDTTDEDRLASEISPGCSGQQDAARVLPQKCVEEGTVDKGQVSKKPRKISHSSDLTEIVKVAKEINSQITKTDNNANEAFAQYVCSRLEQMTALDAKRARQDIVQILES